MKTYIRYIAFTVLAVLALSCKKADTDPERPVTKLEIAFMSEGEPVDTLSFSSLGQTADVDLVVNNENLNWTVTSDKNWCVVENGTGKGSGTFRLVLSVNESFDSRDTASITFTAGAYTDPKPLKIVQLGTNFILSQPYFLSARNGQTFTNVTVKYDTTYKLEIACPEWITPSVTKETVKGSVKTTTLKIVTSKNEDKARTAEMTFAREGIEGFDAKATVYQFGNELKYDASGNILMPADKDSTFTFLMPNDILDMTSLQKGFKDYTHVTATAGPEMTEVAITFDNNLNDCMENRTAKNMYISLYNKARCIIPTVFQPYASCYGINTAKGFLNFAKTVNAGGDITPWMKEGAVHILSNIDMTSIGKSWPGIGTEEYPFTGEFDGTYHAISGFTSQNPLFGVCKDATIKAILLDDSNKFQFSEDPGSETGIALASVAGKVYGTTIFDCSNSGTVTLNKSVLGENVNFYVSGIVGYADKDSKINKCENLGKVSATSAMLATATDNNVYVAGIAGYAECEVSECNNTAEINDGAAVLTHYIGGICARHSGIVSKCSHIGPMAMSSVRDDAKTGVTDQSRYIYAGGVAGCSEADILNCSSEGDISITSNVKYVSVGGVSAEVKTPDLKLQGNSSSMNISSSSTVRYLYLGGLYGCVSARQHLVYSPDTEPSTGAFTVTELENYSGGQLCIGGFIGAVKNCELEIENPVWTRTINGTFTKQAHNISYFSVGGILGGSYFPGAADAKPAKVTIRNAQNNKGAITFILAGTVAFGSRIGCIAGIAGTINGEAVIDNCVNSCEFQIGASATSAGGQANNYSTVLAGIVGRVFNGNASFTTCTNNGGMRNWTYNNNLWSYSYTFADNGLSVFTCNLTAGILGAFLGPENTSSRKLYMKDCLNGGYCYSYRGQAAGIVGSAREAELVNCESTGSLGSGQRSYVGGIMGTGYNVSLTNCKAVCILNGRSAGSAVYSAGGIISQAQGTGTLTSCSYFGDINCDAYAKKGESQGAVIGNTVAFNDVDTPNYVLDACKWGGKLSGITEDTIELNSDNFTEWAVGKSTLSAGSATINDNCIYWNGK